MQYKLVYPNYQNCVLNLLSSIVNSYGIPSSYSPLPCLPLEGFSKKKNIILILLDGLGEKLLQKQKPEQVDFIKKHYLTTLTSLCPSTTTSVLSSILTGLSPIEHGALGWTLFFKECYQFLDFLPLIDHNSHQPLNSLQFNIYEQMNWKTISQQISGLQKELDQFYFVEEHIAHSGFSRISSINTHLVPYHSLQDLFFQLKKLIQNNSHFKFIYIYSSNPDYIQHNHGTNHHLVSDYISSVNDELKKFYQDNQSGETLLLLTADHGLLNISHYYDLVQDKKLFQSLILPPIFEPRFLTLFIKPHRMDQFKGEILKYQNDFVILSREEVLDQNLLGSGTPHPRVDDFIGDYLLIGNSDKGISTYPPSKSSAFPVAMHGGLTDEEMLVPLIKIDL
ncbi:MAG: alkaline phosphatase family protein [Spirochaetes bacterium]|nr:alkaline phosphatase family protein [Spirochaetota bacterium]